MTKIQRTRSIEKGRWRLAAVAWAGLWIGIAGLGSASAEPNPDAGTDAINQRLYEQLGQGDVHDGRIQQVSGQLYLSQENLEASVIREALAELLDQQQTADESIAIQRGPRLNFEIHFAKNSAQLTEHSRAGLDELGSVLQKSYADMQFMLGGHTDMDGDDAVNEPLSQARADAARRYLIEQHGLAADRLVAKGFGSADPLREVEATAQDKLYNRRVDLRPMR